MFALTLAVLLSSLPDGCAKADATIAKAIRSNSLTMFYFCDGAKAATRDGKVLSLMVTEAEQQAWLAFGSRESSDLEVAEHNHRVLKTAATAAELGKARTAYDAKRAAFHKSWSKAAYERAVKSYKGPIAG